MVRYICLFPDVFVYSCMGTYKIYTLEDSTTGEIRYIGKTSQKLSYRLNQHIAEAIRSKGSTHKLNWIRGLIKKDSCPTICELDETNDPESCEIYWIAQFRAWGFRLTNMTDGGDGNNNQYRNPLQYVVRSMKMKGRVVSQETRDKISKAHMGKKVSEATREKLRLCNLGKSEPMEQRRKKYIGVTKMDLFGNVIEVYEALRIAARENSCRPGSISNVCRGYSKTAVGFKWKYTNV